MFRAVIAVDDPGVPNWLDPNGNTTGTMVVRNYRSPEPTTPPALRRVPVRDLRAALPVDTPTTTPAQRQEALDYRRAGTTSFLLR